MKRPQIHLLACLPLVLLTTGSAGPLAASPQDDSAGATAQERSGQEHGIAALAWMAGAWKGSGLGGSVEEHWSEPAGGSMVGMFRLVQKTATSFVQYMLIETESTGRVTLRFKHFNPGFQPWEKADPLSFELRSVSSSQAVFESRDLKQVPARLTYSIHGDSAMSVVIESPQALGGPISFEVLLERAE